MADLGAVLGPEAWWQVVTTRVLPARLPGASAGCTAQPRSGVVWCLCVPLIACLCPLSPSPCVLVTHLSVSLALGTGAF